jgi:MFS family permease
VWQVLRRPGFTIVWLGEAVSITGDVAYEVAFAWLVLIATRSPAVLAGVLVAGSVPRGLLLLVGGAITDRFQARTVMFCSHVVRGLLVGLLYLAVLAGRQPVWGFFAVSIVFGIADAFFWPASGSVVPSLVRADQLPRANALVSLGEQTARLLGPVAGGVLVAATGPATTIGIDALTFFVAAISVLAAPRTRGSGRPVSMRELVSLVSQIGAGLSYARRNPNVRVILVVVSAGALAYSGMFGVGLPALAKTLPQGSVALGAIVSAWGLGQFLGALSAGVTGLPQRWGVLIIGMACCEAAGFAIVGVVPNLAVVVVVLAVLGFGTAYSSDVALPTWLQVNTPAEFLGRVNSIVELPRVALEPVSLAIMGLLAARDPRLIFLFAALPLLGVAILLLSSPTARSLRVGGS